MDESEGKRGNVLFFTIVILVLLLVLVVLVYFIRFRTSTTSQASFPNTARTVSIDNSYLFSSPVRAKAGGDLIRVTVFLLDSDGNGVFGKKVEVKGGPLNLTVKDIQSVSDETGKSLFDIESSSTGSYMLDVYVEGLLLNQKAKVYFD